MAFRVIADHIRTLGFAIADGIQPSNEGRGYVLRRILRRAVRYGRTLGFHEPFFYKLVDVLARTMGDVFPEIRSRKKHVQDVIRAEEEAFNKTLDEGIAIFEESLRYEEYYKSYAQKLGERLREFSAGPNPALRKHQVVLDQVESIMSHVPIDFATESRRYKHLQRLLSPVVRLTAILSELRNGLTTLSGAIELLAEIVGKPTVVSAELAFALYDTYGFPLDLTELMARERGLTVDVAGFNKLMDEQKARARAAQKKEVISLSQIETTAPTKFVGYESLETKAKVVEVVSLKDKTAVVLDTSPFYAEMGGQVGDTGELSGSGQLWRVTNTQKSGNAWLHFMSSGGSGEERVNRKSQIVNSVAPADFPAVGATVTLTVDKPRRSAIQRHHTVTHLLHWALHEVVSKDATQKGSFVGPDKLTFDFNAQPLTQQQVADIEKMVNERILENAGVSWTEAAYAEMKIRKDVMQFFGEKYGEVVRVVQIGGRAGELNGYSMELCGGTHTRATGEIGLFRIVSESAIAAGVRRIEAIAGLEAYRKATDELQLIKSLAGKVNSPVPELERKIEALLEQQKALEKQFEAMQHREAAGAARTLLAKAATLNGTPAIIERFDADGDTLQGMVNELKGQFKGVVVLGGVANNAVALIASVSPEFTSKIQAGKMIQQIAPIVGGKGGGRPDNARGGGKNASKLEEALAKARALLG